MGPASGPHGIAGIGFDRREALRLGAQAAALVSLAAVAGALSGCSADEPRASGRDHRPLLLTLGLALIPFTATPGVGDDGNAAFVVRAVEAGLLGVRHDLLDAMDDEMARRSHGAFLAEPPLVQADRVARLDADVFASAAPLGHPWYAVKALMLMSYYTSEAGMTQELRYELAPGRYDSDVPVDRDWRPLSNDWAAVAIKKPIHA